MKFKTSLIVTVLCFMGLTHGVFAQETLLLPSDGGNWDEFGMSVSCDDGLILIGAPYHGGAPYQGGPEGHGHTDMGAAYLFDAFTGDQLFEFVSPDLEDNEFGGAVSLSDGVALICMSQWGDNFPYTAYLFDADPQSATFGQLLVELNTSGRPYVDEWGTACDLNGGIAIIGGNDAPGIVFDADPSSASFGQEILQLSPWWDTSYYGDGGFGNSVAISDGIAIVGAPYANLTGQGDPWSAHGTAGLFDVDPGSATFGQMIAPLSPTTLTLGTEFGTAVDVADGIAVVLSGYVEDTGRGRLSVFDADPSSPSFGQLLGEIDPEAEVTFYEGSVSMAGGYAIVGAPDGGPYSHDGSALLFSVQAGQQMTYWIGPSGPCWGANFGHSVSLAPDGTMCVGAPGYGEEVDDPYGYGTMCTESGIASSLSSDCNANGIPDFGDVLSGTSLDLNNNWIPDECEPDCDGDGLPDFLAILYGLSLDCNGNEVPDECDLASGTSQDCDASGVPDECETDCNANGIGDVCDLAAGTSMDCNSNGIPDECDIASGYSIDANSDGQPDECKPDCNENGVPDYIDVTLGVSQDCDQNGIPDECEADCNANGILDVCDLVNGTSADCNFNAVPDECDPDCDLDGTPDDCEGSPDCDGNGIPDECDPDCDGDGTPDGCDPPVADCNANGIEDLCDITSGTSEDCNQDFVPDECQDDCNGNGIPDDCDWPGPDCNNNGIDDECDLATETSADCNFNGVPDECDIVDGEVDCDLDGVPDTCQIYDDPDVDQNNNGLLDSCECSTSNYCPAELNTTGLAGAISFNGSAFVSFNDLTLTASDVPANQFGIFYYGPNQVNGGLGAPFGEGRRCVGGQTVRLQVVNTGSSGAAERDIDNTQFPHSQNLQPGSTWHFQFWYRDPNGGPSGWNLTDALSITFCP